MRERASWLRCSRPSRTENRLTILLALAESESSVTVLADCTGLEPLVSHHLKLLRDAGLVSATPAGRSNVYRLCCDAISHVVADLSDLAIPSDPNEEQP